MGTFLEYAIIGLAAASLVAAIALLLARVMFWSPIEEDVNPFDQPRRTIERDYRAAGE